MSITSNAARPLAASALRSATTLALWSAAIAAGASPDAVLEALAADGMPRGARAASRQAVRSSLPGPGQPHAGAADFLGVLRTGGPAQLVLPQPGDMRGLPPGGEITMPALDVGAVVVLPEHEVGLIPMDGHWRAYPCSAVHPALPEADARRLVAEALCEATAALHRADLARSTGDPRQAVRVAIRAEEVAMPYGMPAAAADLLAQSIMLQAVLQVAAVHETAAATSREVGIVRDALAPLATAVRESRRTAVAMAVNTWHRPRDPEQPERPHLGS